MAALLGGLIGIERERSQAEQHEASFAGVRTFPLIAALGASLTVVTGQVGLPVVSGFLALAALTVASYLRTTRDGHPGATTEIAAFTTYWVGVMAGAGALTMAAAIGVGTVVLLASKKRLEAFPRMLTTEELSATLTLAVIAAVILPMLPDRPMGPWGVWNPSRLWRMVVLVCGISFAAFVAMRWWGARWGLYLSGVLGGLVSSTAATVSLATRSRALPAQSVELAAAAGLASLVMIFRVAFLCWVAGRAVLLELTPFLMALAAAGGLAVGILLRRTPPTGDVPGVSNPFELRTALKFTVLYAGVLLAVEGAERYLGTWGLVAAAILAGLTDVDAITLALAASPSVPPTAAALGIALAALSNTMAKAAFAAWLGSKPFRNAMLVILGAALLTGLAVLVTVGPRPWSNS